MKKDNKISIIVPVYFNEKNLESLYENLYENVFKKIDCDYELIFVDDGSKDKSYEVLCELAKKDNKIKLIKLSRNFGSHAAILAGLSNATGNCATSISADLQDPPTIIISMYEKWLKGSKVILAVRKDREESFIQKAFSNFYYNVIRKIALPSMPKGGFDCFLIDKKVINIIKNMEEKNTTLMGQILWCGFKTETINYIRKKRDVGKSRWTISKKVKLFLDSILSFSYFPIRFISLIGLMFSSVSFIWLIYILVVKFTINISTPGWTTLILVVLLSFGLMFIMLGIIGEYLWRTFDASRNRPVYIIEEIVNDERSEKK